MEHQSRRYTFSTRLFEIWIKLGQHRKEYSIIEENYKQYLYCNMPTSHQYNKTTSIDYLDQTTRCRVQFKFIRDAEILNHGFCARQVETTNNR